MFKEKDEFWCIQGEVLTVKDLKEFLLDKDDNLIVYVPDVNSDGFPTEACSIRVELDPDIGLTKPVIFIH